MKPLSRRERIAAQLADLKLPGALEALDEVLAGVDGGGTTRRGGHRASPGYPELASEPQTELRSSRLPAIKTLADFSFQPSIKREQIDSLHELGFVEQKENVVLPASARPTWPSAWPSLRPRAAGRSTTAP